MQNPNASWQVLRGTESAIAGAGAGLVSATITCPLDVVKTKLQAEGAFGVSNPKYKGLFGTLSRIWAEEGPRGLYRGLGPTIFGFMPTWAIYFTGMLTCMLCLAAALIECCLLQCTIESSQRYPKGEEVSTIPLRILFYFDICVMNTF